MDTTDARYAKQHDGTQAAAALRETEISLSIAVGSLELAKISERKVTIRITGGAPNWSSPGDLIGDNIATGKCRRFHHTAILHAVGGW